MTAPLQRFAVLGAGSWGTALAVQLARRGHTVALWARDSQAIAAHEAARCNTRYLADTPWPDTLTGESDLARAVAGADDVLVVVPSHALADCLAALAPHLRPDQRVLWATKGLEPDTARLPHEVGGEPDAREHMPRDHVPEHVPPLRLGAAGLLRQDRTG